MDDRNDDFSLRLEFDGDGIPATVTVSGDVDLVTAPALGGVLNSMVDAGQRRIVVDLAAAGCVDARGAAALVDAALRAAAFGGDVTIRSASGLTRRMLTITGISAVVSFEEPRVGLTPSGDAARPGRLTEASAEGPVPFSSPAGLAQSSIDVVDAALRLVTALAETTVSNADGVSVTLERHGRLMTVAASNDKVLTMDRHQYETGEGPCLDAKAEGRWFYSESLADETRWPAFVPLALEQGIGSILASPLRTSERPQGSLNIYSTTRQAFGKREQELASLFASQASQILTAGGQQQNGEALHERFVSALTTRQVIHQAQGVVMVREHLDADAALASLFRSARDADLTVADWATAVVASLRPQHGSS